MTCSCSILCKSRRKYNENGHVSILVLLYFAKFSLARVEKSDGMILLYEKERDFFPAELPELPA